jgi:hypothetical protein
VGVPFERVGVAPVREVDGLPKVGVGDAKD